MIEFIRWQLRFMLLEFETRAERRLHRLVDSSFVWGEGRFAAFVDRLSPFDRRNGYKRLPLRRTLYRLRYPGYFARRWFWATSWAIADRFAPYTGSGRFEGLDKVEQTKARWLNAHSEYRDAIAGGGDYPLGLELFTDLSVPWSREPESWTLEYDEQGFVYALQYQDAIHARIAFGGFEYRVSVFEDELHCDLCDEVAYASDLTPDWNGESGNHLSCEARVMAERDPSEVYGTQEHEDWLIFMERQEG